MCKRNSPDLKEASMGRVRETPQIKNKVRMGCVRETPQKKNNASAGSVRELTKEIYSNLGMCKRNSQIKRKQALDV